MSLTVSTVAKRYEDSDTCLADEGTCMTNTTTSKASETRLGALLQTVKRGERELTLDCSSLTDSGYEIVVAEARARGLHCSGYRRVLLIRQF